MPQDATCLYGEEEKKKKKKVTRIEMRVKANLAEARGAGGELPDLNGLVVIGVVLVIRVYVMITI